MPDNYEQSVSKIQDYMSDEQICMILSSDSSIAANKLILDCLIEKVNSRKDLCRLLKTISTSHELNKLISGIRSGKVYISHESAIIGTCDIFHDTDFINYANIKGLITWGCILQVYYL